MSTQVVDHDGVLFEVQYDLPEPVQAGPLINSVRVLGQDYAPVGPNLVYLFDKMFMLISQEEGTKFLSMVSDQLAPGAAT